MINNNKNRKIEWIYQTKKKVNMSGWERKLADFFISKKNIGSVLWWECMQYNANNESGKKWNKNQISTWNKTR